MAQENKLAAARFDDTFIQFDNIRFAYPPAEEKAETRPIFQNFTAVLPGGFVSLVGPNASGKSTFMLLAAGRILPQQGTVYLLGRNTLELTEEERSQLASFIYQNMEFDTKDTVAQLVQQVYTNGCFQGCCRPVALESTDHKDLLEQVKWVLELDELGEKPLSTLSKGQMQRVILGFSLLYGSKSIFMDEPLFAVENKQKHRILDYIRKYCEDFGITVYISMHELELSRMYPHKVLLFYPNRDMDFGTPQEVLVPDALEKAYGVPAAMLKDAESLTRRSLQEQYQDSEG